MPAVVGVGTVGPRATHVGGVGGFRDFNMLNIIGESGQEMGTCRRAPCDASLDCPGHHSPPGHFIVFSSPGNDATHSVERGRPVALRRQDDGQAATPVLPPWSDGWLTIHVPFRRTVPVGLQ